ncbi:MAG: DUF655 domain-containing protein [Desulfurococcaceae archaeon]|nr:DUF655 domain-containing protein [Sulfolobales archaeon]MDW8170360.1 DUF655 domain-containing protein [Desulfurococcaceae archaeon]
MSRGFHWKRERRIDRERDDREIEIYVLDHMPYGNPLDKYPMYRNKPVAQVIGSRYFMLLEVEPYSNIELLTGERMYLDRESKVRRVVGRITYNDLTSNARANLEDVVRRIVLDNESLFVEMFNKAEPINIRLHTLELLPGIGRKSVRAILEEREKRKFTSFKDIQERLKIVDVAKSIVDRIVMEIVGDGEKYFLFVKPLREQAAAGAIYLDIIGKIKGISGGIGHRPPPS